MLKLSSLFVLSIATLLNSGCAPAAQAPDKASALGNTTTAVASSESPADASAATPSTDPPSAQENQPMPQLETATFGAGCFWCVEAVLLRIRGVDAVVSGYMGGSVPKPTYEAVCTGRTGHAEVVQVKFDPAQLPYEKLLDIFWQLHDPTTLNRQGPDSGTQYRSAIFYHSDAQRQAAEASKEKWDKSGKFNSPIVTEITAASEFYPAEGYHQDFFNKNPANFYCRINILPKFKKLGLLKETDLSP